MSEADVADEIESLRADVQAPRVKLDTLRAELDELRAYIGEVPCAECGSTSYEKWRAQRNGG